MPLVADPLDPPTAPGSTNSYTIGDICNRLDTGAAGTQIPFTEPTAAPGSTGCTFNEVMSKAPVEDNTNGALINEVLLGKTFWGLRTDGTWGLQTGTLATQTPTDTTVNQPAGNYSAFDLSTVDTDLTAANIKSGVTIFGVLGTAALPKTGQTICYNAVGTIITCAGTGQDGDKSAGATLPSPRFTSSDGTVTDNLTGLIWLKNANCFATRDWTTALLDTNNLSNGTCGLTDGSSAGDWRLPNLNELRSLINAEYYNPALSNASGTAKWTEGDVFSGVESDEYWSSTTDANPTANDKAWYVHLIGGHVHSTFKSNSFYVWPVRGGM